MEELLIILLQFLFEFALNVLANVSLAAAPVRGGMGTSRDPAAQARFCCRRAAPAVINRCTIPKTVAAKRSFRTR